MKVKISKKSKMALLGLGLENKSLLLFLAKKYKEIDITICDFRKKTDLLNIYPEIKKIKNLKWQNEKEFDKNLEKFSLLFRSPGWPLACPAIKKAEKGGSITSSPMNLFFQLCPSKNIIAVSGTKGKGSTSSLIFKILKDSGKKVFLGGNIGIATFDFLNKIKKNDWIVLELSSFQLEDLKFRPKIAVLTNLFKDHLSSADPNNPNFHKNTSLYLKAKMSLALEQEKNDFFVVNERIKNKIKNYIIKSKVIYFSKSDSPSKMVGEYNKENIAAAEEVAKVLKIRQKDYKKSIANFSNLNHRLEFSGKINSCNYYDNSFSTTPESTILDLKSFKENIIMIAGGSDKGASFKKLAEEIKTRVKYIIFFPGKGSDRIIEELKKIKYPSSKIFLAKNMGEAVKKAKEKSSPGDSILLSTACASFGIFKNYKERGDLFQKEVKKYL